MMNKKVCLIDDDEIYHFIFKKQVTMSNKDVEVLSFPNGQKGFDYILNLDQNNIPDIIFLDINMPVMDGWNFLEKFSEIKDKFSGPIKIYLVTSSIDERDISKAKQNDNVVDYLVKPVSELKIKEILEVA